MNNLRDQYCKDSIIVLVLKGQIISIYKVECYEHMFISRLLAQYSIKIKQIFHSLRMFMRAQPFVTKEKYFVKLSGLVFFVNKCKLLQFNKKNSLFTNYFPIVFFMFQIVVSRETILFLLLDSKKLCAFIARYMCIYCTSSFLDFLETSVENKTVKNKQVSEP